MILNSLIVLSLLGLVLGSPTWNSGAHDQNHGPLAPLNRDGTVAFTPEYELVRAAHRAIFELEHERLKNKLSEEHPDLIPHLSQDTYVPHTYERGLHTHDNGQYKPDVYKAEFSGFRGLDDGQYNPKIYEEQYISQYDDGQYKPHLYNKQNHYSKNYDHGKYKPQLHQNSQYNSPAYKPSTLNADGTVAHTPEYKAVAASFLDAYHQALSRHRRSTERYQGPPAPLNHDLTVDNTPEVKHFNAAHFTAVANHYKKLQDTSALAAAHPDRTSPPSKDYNPQNNGQYIPLQHVAGKYQPHVTKQGQYSPELYRPHLHHSKHYDDGQYRPHLYEQGQHYTQQLGQSTSHHPVQLNSDGTIPHTPQYNSFAGSFHGAHNRVLHRHRRSEERWEGPPAPLNEDFTVDFTPETKKVTEAHFAALANQFKRLQVTADLAAAHPDRTSPPSPGYKPNYNVQ